MNINFTEPYRRGKYSPIWLGKYSPIFTEPEANNCFSIFLRGGLQKSKKKELKLDKTTHEKGNLVYQPRLEMLYSPGSAANIKIILKGYKL